MKKVLLLLVSFKLAFFPHLAAAAEDPRINARALVQASHMKARQDAVSLVNTDFSHALLDVMFQAAAQNQNTSSLETYRQQLGILEGKVQKILQSQDTSAGSANEFVLSLWQDYKESVRDRFALSFKVQEHLYNQNLVLDLTTQSIAKFEHICQNGRSETGLKYYHPLLENLPNPEIYFEWNYQLGSNGGLHQVKGRSSNSTGKDKNRQETESTLYLAASTTSSIAFAGGTGSALAMAAAPWAVGAAVLYGAYNKFATSEEQRRLQNQIAEANILMFKDTANDQDIARYYREACQDLIPLTASFRHQIEALRGTPEQRDGVIQKALQLREELESYQNESQTQSVNLELLRLAYAIKSGQCLEVSNEGHEKAPCAKTGTHYASKENSDLTLPLDEKERENVMAPIEASAKAFAQKYPQVKRIALLAAQLTLVLGPQWEFTARALHQMSFDTIDSFMSATLERIQVLLAQHRSLQTAHWNQNGDPIFEEMKIQSEFNELKNQQRHFVTLGMKVIFNRMDRREFQKRVENYLEKARKFGRRHHNNRQVKSFLANVEGLASIYKTL